MSSLFRPNACIVEHAGGGNCGGMGTATTTQSSSCPPIITRSEWGARKPKGRTSIVQPIRQVFIHHTDEWPRTSLPSCVLRVKSIQDYHMDKRGIGMLWCSNVSHTCMAVTLWSRAMSTVYIILEKSCSRRFCLYKKISYRRETARQQSALGAIAHGPRENLRFAEHQNGFETRNGN